VRALIGFPDLNEKYHPFTDLVEERLLISRWATADRTLRGSVPLPGAETARRRWRDAVSAQATLSRQGEAVAERAVVSMLNQMLRLARVMPWWESHATAAITETVEYAIGNVAVASASAQRAWGTYWSAHSLLGSSFGVFGPDSSAPDEAELQTLNDRMSEAEAEWHSAWDLWCRARS
jgi:hypothetical protein